MDFEFEFRENIELAPVVSDELRVAVRHKIAAAEHLYIPAALRKTLIWRGIRRYAAWNIINILYDMEEEPGGDIKNLNGILLLFGGGGMLEPLICSLSGIPIALLVYNCPDFMINFVVNLVNLIWSNPPIGFLLVSIIIMACLVFIPLEFEEQIKTASMIGQIIMLVFTLLAFGRFNLSVASFQYQFYLYIGGLVNPNPTLSANDLVGSYFNLCFGIDALSLILVMLTVYLFFIGFLLNWNSVTIFIKELNICLHLLQFFILGSLLTLDIFWFYLFFEATLLPLFILIGVWGSREQKIAAAYKLFFYTFVTSMVTLVGLATIVRIVGSGNFFYLESVVFDPLVQKYLFILLIFSFAAKLPIVPLHLWLPEAHVEAPTVVSIILAGILLKLGGYGMCRFLIPLFPAAVVYFAPLTSLLGLISIFYSAFISLRFADLKKIIAYSSISHMGVVFLALSYISPLSLAGAIVNMFSHGLISGGLFAVVGILYDRYKTRSLLYYSGLATTMPLFSTCYFLLSLANLGLPGFSSFISEFLSLSGVMAFNTVAAIIASFSIIFNAVNSLWLFNRVCFGQLTTKYLPIHCDVTAAEFLALVLFIVPALIIGLYPAFLTDLLEPYVEHICTLAEIKLKLASK